MDKFHFPRINSEAFDTLLNTLLDSGPQFTKGLKQKNCHDFRRKVLTVQEFCHKVKTLLIRQNGIHKRS